jgi:hypothetical protein
MKRAVSLAAIAALVLAAATTSQARAAGPDGKKPIECHWEPCGGFDPTAYCCVPD